VAGSKAPNDSKAWLFVCSVAGGEQSAKMMTLVSSARRHDLDVWLYVKNVLDQLLAGSTDYQSLLPDIWKQRHPQAVRAYRVEERRDKADRKQLNAARRRLAISGEIKFGPPTHCMHYTAGVRLHCFERSGSGLDSHFNSYPGNGLLKLDYTRTGDRSLAKS
jgi:hypothetical protein